LLSAIIQSIVMMNVTLLSVVVMKAINLSIVLLFTIMPNSEYLLLSVIMLSVVLLMAYYPVTSKSLYRTGSDPISLSEVVTMKNFGSK
jgi:hypothetical protein